jgi:DNA-binding response OmpR family regulator
MLTASAEHSGVAFTHITPASESQIRPVSSATSDPAWLVLADSGPAVELGTLAPIRNVHVTRESAELRDLLRRTEPRVVVCSEPPASAADLELVAIERARRPRMRIIHLSPAADIDRRLAALRAGFDDALPSSISAAELIGRLGWQDSQASIASSGDHRLRFGDDLELDLSAHELRRRGQRIHLRPKEFGLLALLASTPGRAWTRDELLARVWGAAEPADRGGRTVDVHVRWLRSKIESDPERPTCLVTVRGTGYRLDGPDRTHDAAR